MKNNYIYDIYENYYYPNLNCLDYRIKNTINSEWISKIFKINRKSYHYRKNKNQLNKLYTNIYYITQSSENFVKDKWTFNCKQTKHLSIKHNNNNKHNLIKVLSTLISKKTRYVKHFQSFSLQGYNIMTEKVVETKHVKMQNFFTMLNEFNNNVYNQKKAENK
jgi:hypothetical protein